jgi:hypothetical protein
MFADNVLLDPLIKLAFVLRITMRVFFIVH